MIEEIDFTAEHPKADMSNVNMIRVNDKEYVAIDNVLNIIDGIKLTASDTDDVDRDTYIHSLGWNDALDEMVRRAQALKGGAE
ncbi:MAG: hypothetical protein IJP92_00695 [Lachnospiraceae bacterium]|nr:hypothetical protein [Lachnospiraceae bacterium]